jgi:hypothetical protein
MQDATTLVYQALDPDAQLIILLGGKDSVKGWNRIYNDPVAPNANEYPRITMFEVVNDDANPADDEPQDSDVNIRIDHWTKDSSTIYSVCKQIKKILKAAFNACIIQLGETIYESDTKVYHKPINVYLLLEQESDE